MQIRTSTPQDKPAMIELLRMSLGESTIPKSESLWNWKHEENPFGQSYVLLAEENNMLVGLRAFMKWEWEWKGKIYKAIRAVDTATHPEHQGKGIFKKLTLHQIGVCKQEGVSFVFNTPNTQSKPGYLKMGWVEQAKLPLKFKILRPVSLAYNRFFDKNKQAGEEEQPTVSSSWEAGVSDLVVNTKTRSELLSSRITPAYISWRYARNPLFRYDYFTDKKNFLLVSRIKKHSFANELRLVDFMSLNPGMDVKRINRDVKKQVIDFCRQNKIHFISISGLQYKLNKDCFEWMGLLPVRDLGPIITLKDLNMGDQFQELLKIENWSYSLGDLELF